MFSLFDGMTYMYSVLNGVLAIVNGVLAIVQLYTVRAVYKHRTDSWKTADSRSASYHNDGLKLEI